MGQELAFYWKPAESPFPPFPIFPSFHINDIAKPTASKLVMPPPAPTPVNTGVIQPTTSRFAIAGLTPAAQSQSSLAAPLTMSIVLNTAGGNVAPTTGSGHRLSIGGIRHDQPLPIVHVEGKQWLLQHVPRNGILAQDAAALERKPDAFWGQVGGVLRVSCLTASSGANSSVPQSSAALQSNDTLHGMHSSLLRVSRLEHLRRMASHSNAISIIDVRHATILCWQIIKEDCRVDMHSVKHDAVCRPLHGAIAQYRSHDLLKR